MAKTLSKVPWADLHCHSQASDGTLTPADLVRLAKESGLHGLCITDHDTTAAYVEAIPIAQSIGLHLGAGVEFSCVFEGYDVHLLGYDFELSSIAIEALCQRHYRRRQDRNLKMLEKLREEGMDITSEELEAQGKGDSVGRLHIAQAMLEKKYVSSIKEAFHLYLGEGKRCYVRGDSLSVDETIEAIHSAHGKVFVAHPHLLASSFPIERLLEHPFDGIECFYSKTSKKSADRWAGIAYKNGWIMSGGSDFHGSVKPDIPLGCKGVDQSTFYQIFEHPLA